MEFGKQHLSLNNHDLGGVETPPLLMEGDTSFVGQAWRSLLDPYGSTSPSGMVDLQGLKMEMFHCLCKNQ